MTKYIIVSLLLVGCTNSNDAEDAMSMARLAQSNVETQAEKIANLEKELADTKDEVVKLRLAIEKSQSDQRMRDLLRIGR